MTNSDKFNGTPNGKHSGSSGKSNSERDEAVTLKAGEAERLEQAVKQAQGFDRTNALVAVGVFLLTLYMYARTVAPTLSFWDCGEFIAVSSILGIPHPPGSPLYVILGRLFSILPIADDPAMRVNLLSSVSSAGAAMFGYLIVVRLLRAWFTEWSVSNRVIVYGGGVAGALFAAFGLTNWNNSVEAEVYGLTVLLMLAIFWLGLVYRRHEGTPQADRIMLLAVFLAAMGVGVHLMAFVALPIVALFFILKKGAPNWVWFVVASFLALEMYLIFALSSRPGEVAYYVPVAIAAVFYFLYMFSFEQIPRTHMLFALGFLVAILPLVGSLVEQLTGAGGAGDILDVIGVIGFAGLVVGGGYLGWYYSNNRHQLKDGAHTYLAPVGFVAAAAVLVALLYVFKGYKPFMLLTVILGVLMLWFIRKYIRWEILIAIVAVATIIIEVKPFFLAVGVAALALALLGLARMLPGWKSALMVLAAAVVGFSINAFIPVRASQEPAINENNPQTIGATIDFLDRKQYMQVSMVERMFERRGEWENQFGNYRRMGFWGFFHEQYGLRGPASVFLILIGLFGAWEVVRRRPKLGLALVLLLLITTVGLVLYMNFADGTRQHPVTGADYLEVRNRDYFWTAGFVLFGMSIGLGLAFLVSAIRDAIGQPGSGAKTVVTAVAAVLFAAPVIVIAGNYHYADRSGNYIPYDYGMNLLDSAGPKSILFTHGDNDTFPLWCLQETYGERTDVALVNLSLANTNWYVKQIRSIMGLELPWTDEEIDQLRTRRLADGSWYRLQDMVIDALMDRYYDERPIYFSVTVGSGARTFRGEPIDNRLTMEGMLYRVREPHGRINVDVEESMDFFMNRFRARGVDDPEVYQDDVSERLTRNYGNAFLMVADTLRKAGRLDEAEALVQHGWDLVPHAGDMPEFLATLYTMQGRVNDVERLVDTVKAGDIAQMRTLLARSYAEAGDTAKAEQTLEAILKTHFDYRRALEELMRIQIGQRDMDGLKSALRLWVRYNPNDQQIVTALRQLEAGATWDQLLGEPE